ncbi:MAG TPA: hypothetical protein VMS22_03940 [Candidatus Eisenbacteria bacterium]|nr:hypothetical protein [Candidatus Eisenbacteria bacterium]
MRALPLVTLVALLFVAAHAAEAAFCKKRNGAVFSRDACKAKETEVDLAAVGGAPKGDPGAPGKSQPRLRAVDANGVQVPGTFDTLLQFVFRLPGRRPFSFAFGPNGLVGGIVWFDGPTCTGGRWISSQPILLYDVAFIDGTTAYYPGDPVEMHAIMSFGLRTVPEQCTGVGRTYIAAAGLCCTVASGSITAGPPTPVDLGGFVPPFRVEVEE